MTRRPVMLPPGPHEYAAMVQRTGLRPPPQTPTTPLPDGLPPLSAVLRLQGGPEVEQVQGPVRMVDGGGFYGLLQGVYRVFEVSLYCVALEPHRQRAT
jgi:hypothetical protein